MVVSEDVSTSSSSRFLFFFCLSSLSFPPQAFTASLAFSKSAQMSHKSSSWRFSSENHLSPIYDSRVQLDQDPTHALGASVDDRIRRCDMTFKMGEIVIRMVVTKPPSIVSLAQEWFGFHTRKGYKLISRFRMERPLRKMDVSV